MANQAVFEWHKGLETNPAGVAIAARSSDFYLHYDYWICYITYTDNLANGDWVVTAPFPTHINSDFIIYVQRIGGSSSLNLNMEGSVVPLSPLLSDTTTWDSITGANADYEISGSTAPTAGGDWFKWDVAENGIMPLMRLAHKNESGSNETLAWKMYLSFMRNV